eukprot:3081618-Prorocentrum_lima.AAC.1
MEEHLRNGHIPKGRIALSVNKPKDQLPDTINIQQGNRPPWTQMCADHGPQVEEGRGNHTHSLGGTNQAEV